MELVGAHSSPNTPRSAFPGADKTLRDIQHTDLPIDPPNQFDLVVNLKMAKAFGITVPESVLLRADEMIRGAFAFALMILVVAWGPYGLAVAADASQHSSPRHIGVLLGAWLPEEKVSQAFRQGLLDAGYAEGRDMVIEWRSAKGDYARIPRLVADLVQRKVDVILVTNTVAAQSAKRATSTIPIVMVSVADPVGSGLVASLAHPGGNITGLTTMTIELSAKRLQLLKELIPRLNRVAVLQDPATPWHTKVFEELKAVAPSLSIELMPVSARGPEDFGPAFSAVSRAHAQAVYVIEDLLFFNHRLTLVNLASTARVPIIYWVKEFAQGQGLISYAASYEDLMRRSVGYVDKILRGASPGELPIEQPSKFELVVNVKTAKALGITIPQSILLRADEVIR